VLGKAIHQANAFLKAGLVPVARHAIYGEATEPLVRGSTGGGPQAISEALERRHFMHVERR